MPFIIDTVFFDDVALLQPTRHADHRGYFEETYRADEFIRLGIPTDFVQDNHSYSEHGVLRGLHYQYNEPMGKLLRVVHGVAIFVEVDIRAGSPTFGEYAMVELSAKNGKMLWVPPGFANGFCITSQDAHVSYKCTALHNPSGEGGISPMSPELGIRWPVDNPILSPKDKTAPSFTDYAVNPKFKV